MPGFGRADKPEDFDYTVEGYARHLAGVLDTLEVRRVHLVLHDFGGPWGLQWAATHPDQFASVVLINTGALLDYRWHFFARLWRRKFVGEAMMATFSYPAFKLTWRLRAKRRIPEPALRRMWDNFSGETRRAVLKLYRATDVAWYGEEHRRMLRPLRRETRVISRTSIALKRLPARCFRSCVRSAPPQSGSRTGSPRAAAARAELPRPALAAVMDSMG
jgi:pimeloyl-ACP methyl ester carboxylesterase